MTTRRWSSMTGWRWSSMTGWMIKVLLTSMMGHRRNFFSSLNSILKKKKISSYVGSFYVFALIASSQCEKPKSKIITYIKCE